MIQNSTTRAHYEKYAEMAKLSGVTLKGTTISWIVKAVEFIKEVEAKHDIVDDQLTELLNRATSIYWYDGFFPWTRWSRDNPHGPRSLAENVSMYKHLIAYELLGAVPVFTDKGETNVGICS